LVDRVLGLIVAALTALAHLELVTDAVLHVGANVRAVDELLGAADGEERKRREGKHESQCLEHNVWPKSAEQSPQASCPWMS
jgi:hypothetical protein